MNDFTPIYKILTIGEKYEICFNRIDDETYIRFYSPTKVFQITMMKNMKRYELYQDIDYFDRLTIESSNGDVDYFIRMPGENTWKYIKNSTVADDEKTYKEHTNWLKHSLLSKIDAYRSNPCLSPDENYAMMLESLHHSFQTEGFQLSSRAPYFKLLRQIRKSCMPFNEEVTTNGRIDLDRNLGI